MNPSDAQPESPPLPGVTRAFGVVQRMVHPNGCAWHEAQTHESLTKYLVEEAYECVEAIETGTNEDTAEELGDVLYQVLFHAAIAERDGAGYGLDSLADALADKLIDRHPHVFGDLGYMSESELNAEWEHLKEAARGQARGARHPLEGIPVGMAPLAKSTKVVERLTRSGALEAADLETSRDLSDEEALGDALMQLIAHATVRGMNPDRALRGGLERFISAQLGQEPRA